MAPRFASLRFGMSAVIFAGCLVTAGCGRAGLLAAPDTEGPDGSARTPYRALAVNTGRDQTCVVLDDHRAKCWGKNDFGQLGLGDTRWRGRSASEMGDALPTIDLGTGRTVAAISGGNYHTCAILDDGTVKCWGLRGLCGGPPDAANRLIGDEPGEMGDALPAVDLGAGRTAKLLASGYMQSCAILDDGSARCWGSPPTGMSTLPYDVPLVSSAQVVALAPGRYGVLALFADGAVQDFLWTQGPPIVQAGASSIAIAGADVARCAVLNDGSLDCGESVSITQWFAPLHDAGKRLVAAGVTTLIGVCGLLDDGEVVCNSGEPTCTPCERSADGLLMRVLLGQPAVALTTSGEATFCALLANGAVRCWGSHTDLPLPAVGASFDMTIGDGGVAALGAFHDVDLGSHEGPSQ